MLAVRPNNLTVSTQSTLREKKCNHSIKLYSKNFSCRSNGNLICGRNLLDTTEECHQEAILNAKQCI